MSTTHTNNNNNNNTVDPHLSTLSPYKRAEYECVSGITALRQALHKVTQLESHMDNNNNSHHNNSSYRSSSSKKNKNNNNSDSITELTRARQSARYAHQQLDKLAKDAQRAARRANNNNNNNNIYDTDLKELLHHVDTAKRWYRECFRVVPTHEQQEQKEKEYHYYHNNNNNNKGVGATDLTVPLLHSESKSDNTHYTSISINADAEFQEYAAQVQHNTELSEAALDRIAHGIGRLQDNARQLTSELHTQEILLNDMERKVDTTTMKLTRLNAKLRKAIKSIRKTDCCMYVFCFLLLVAVIVVIIVLIKN